MADKELLKYLEMGDVTLPTAEEAAELIIKKEEDDERRIAAEAVTFVNGVITPAVNKAVKEGKRRVEIGDKPSLRAFKYVKAICQAKNYGWSLTDHYILLMIK